MSIFSAPKPKEDPEAAAQRKQQEDKARQEAAVQSEQSTADLAAKRMGTRGAQALFSAGYQGFPRTMGTANV
jgi:hypothetical protein